MLLETIVGYDARDRSANYLKMWSNQRKNTFLYRLDVVNPFSVDVTVWPSISQKVNRPNTPENFGYQDTWSDLNALQRALASLQQPQPLGPFCLICITLMVGKYGHGKEVRFPSRLPKTTPAEREPAWTFIGYDVADTWMLSALMNCGFVPSLDQVTELRARWAPRLNMFHLFDNFNDAAEFKLFSDERLKADHAPCFVYGLWMIG